MSRTSADTKTLTVTLRYIGGLGEVVVTENGEYLSTGVISSVTAKEVYQDISNAIKKVVLD